MSELLLMPKAVMTPDDAFKQREEFSALVKKALVENQDFGVIQGTDKPTLLQPGADKLLNFYGLTSRTECVEKVENWNRTEPFFMYRYKCSIIWPRPMGKGIREEVIAECEGSANSMESKYGDRWVSYSELTTDQKKLADEGKLTSEGRDKDKPLFVVEKEDPKLWGDIMDNKNKYRLFIKDSKKIDPKTKNPYQVEWVTIPAVKMYSVPNPKVFDQVNTLQKMAQKRAYVGATIKAVKASDLFTQDMEDLAQSYEAPQEVHVAPPAETTLKKGKPPAEDATFTENTGLDAWKEQIFECKTVAQLESIRQEAKKELDEAGQRFLKPHFEQALVMLQKAGSKKTETAAAQPQQSSAPTTHEERIEMIKALLRDCETLKDLNAVIKTLKETERTPDVMKAYNARVKAIETPAAAS